MNELDIKELMKVYDIKPVQGLQKQFDHEVNRYLRKGYVMLQDVKIFHNGGNVMYIAILGRKKDV